MRGWGDLKVFVKTKIMKIQSPSGCCGFKGFDDFSEASLL